MVRTWFRCLGVWLVAVLLSCPVLTLGFITFKGIPIGLRLSDSHSGLDTILFAVFAMTIVFCVWHCFTVVPAAIIGASALAVQQIEKPALRIVTQIVLIGLAALATAYLLDDLRTDTDAPPHGFDLTASGYAEALTIQTLIFLIGLLLRRPRQRPVHEISN